MRASEALTVGVLAAGLGVGCRPAEESVSVTLRPTPAVVAPEAGLVTAEGAVAKEDLPALPARTALLGSGKGQAENALRLARESQARAFSEAKAELRKAFRADALAGWRETRDSRLAEHETRLDAVYASLRGLFEEYATRLGPLRVRLATLVGFPRDSRKPIPKPLPGDFVKAAEYQEAQRIQPEITRLEAEFRQRAAALLEAELQRFREVSTGLEADRAKAVDAAELRADQEASRISSQFLKVLESSMIADIERLPPVPGASATVAMPALTVGPVGVDRGPAWTPADRERRLAAMFADLNGYRLVSPGPGVRDVTQEYERWKASRDGR